ncbi:hypothetical protein [Microvirga vignae]|uniref:hypothetical protein n=1 Tax=Microvirga vignae TaxID=1225564 RepID=UPI001364DE1D|nr:hypothetical protein [Microvirga vignae]
MLQSRKFGLGGIPHLDGLISLSTGGSCFCSRFDQLFKQVGANSIETGDLILG